MTKESGTNVLLYVNAGVGSPTSFELVAGQQTTTWVGNTETDDITDKGHGGWGSTISTLIRGQVNCSGKADWPDTNGLDQVRAAWQARTQIEAQIVLNSSGKKYFGNFYVTAFNIDGAHNRATEYSFTLDSAEALNYAAS